MSLEAAINPDFNVMDFVPVEQSQIPIWENSKTPIINKNGIFLFIYSELPILAPELQGKDKALILYNERLNYLKEIPPESAEDRIRKTSELSIYKGNLDLSLFNDDPVKFNKSIKKYLKYYLNKNNFTASFSATNLHLNTLVHSKIIFQDFDYGLAVKNVFSQNQDYNEYFDEILNYKQNFNTLNYENERSYSILLERFDRISKVYILDQDLINKDKILNSPLYKSTLEFLKRTQTVPNFNLYELNRIVAYLKLINADRLEFSPGRIKLIKNNVNQEISPLPQVRRFS